MRLMFLAAGEADVVNSAEDVFGDVAEVLWSRFATDVRTRAHQSLLETEAEFLRERFLGDADANTAILSDEVLCQVNGIV